jgi:hypothetical protein
VRDGEARSEGAAKPWDRAEPGVGQGIPPSSAASARSSRAAVSAPFLEGALKRASHQADPGEREAVRQRLGAAGDVGLDELGERVEAVAAVTSGGTPSVSAGVDQR